jgi:cytosine/adenosine deaminase-related metal-dependent hydrolase
MKLSREMGFLICATAIALGQEPQTRPKADVVFLHGNIYTGIAVNASFHELKRADAMAIRGDRIQAIGKEEDIVKLKGPQTEVVNLGGHFVMPIQRRSHAPGRSWPSTADR